MAGTADARHAAAGAGTAAAARGAALLQARLLAWRPPRIALALAVAAVGVHLVLWGPQAPWGRAGVSGLLVVAAGLAWVLWAGSLFRSAGTPIRPTAQPLVLIEEGPYRVGRHPMYVGIAFVLLGAALGLGVPLLAAAAGLFAVIVATVHVPHEEAKLLTHFGGWYRDYAASVRRWL
jgi:protein-S-isoprenylcysteine O-methyltransferase Ste14